MAKQQTFRGRLTMQTTLLCLVVLAFAGTAIFFGARLALLTNLDGALLGIARAELASALDGPNGKVHIHEEGDLVLQGATGYEKYALIRDAHGDLAAHTANISPSKLPALDATALQQTQNNVAVFGDIAIGNKSLRAIYYPFHDQHKRQYIAVCAVPYAPMEQSLQLLGYTLLLALTLCGLGAMWGARRLAQRLTLPLAHLAQNAQAIGEENLHERLVTVAGTDEEIAHVTEGLNAMLTRLESAFSERQQMIISQRQFLMDASHELRTPVSNLRGTLEVALRRPRDESAYKETLEICLPEAERLSLLVNDLLTLARAETATLTLACQPLDIVLLIRQAMHLHHAEATSQSVMLCYTGEEGHFITGDASRLRQVLDNLLDNALRYAPPNTKIEIELRQENNQIILSVTDHGKGISPEDIPHIFDRFWRKDASRSRAEGGLGLGLTITRSLVEDQGGAIQVESILGQGTTFKVSLPC
jgi:two-component system, OmpR family, sensor kinase